MKSETNVVVIQQVQRNLKWQSSNTFAINLFTPTMFDVSKVKSKKTNTFNRNIYERKRKLCSWERSQSSRRCRRNASFLELPLVGDLLEDVEFNCHLKVLVARRLGNLDV